MTDHSFWLFLRKFKQYISQIIIDIRREIYKIRGYHIGNNVSIGSNVYLDPKVSIGNDSTIVGNSYFSGRINIGCNVIIARGCTILASNHEYDDTDALPYGTRYIEKIVNIEDNVWIGTNVQITPGVTIGDGAIIGMGSVVTKNVPRLGVAAGNPAQTIKYRNEESYERLSRESKYLNLIRRKIPISRLNMLKNRKIFDELLNSRGFVLSYEMVYAPKRWRSGVLYYFVSQRHRIIFTNAERFHIGISPEFFSDIDDCISNIIKNISMSEMVEITHDFDHSNLVRDIERVFT
jgi:acetyltransferase-like isoleucine patch superfamily enzyme